MSGSLDLEPGHAGRDLSFALRPSWGEAGRGMDRLWDRELTETGDETDRPAALRLDSELGYGLGLQGGLLTPYGGLGMSDDRCDASAPATPAMAASV